MHFWQTSRSGVFHKSADLPGLSHWRCVSPQDLLDGSKKGGEYPVAGGGRGEKKASVIVGSWRRMADTDRRPQRGNGGSSDRRLHSVSNTRNFALIQ